MLVFEFYRVEIKIISDLTARKINKTLKPY